jgi:hypothetical protein
LGDRVRWKEAEEEPEDTNMDMKEAIIQMIVLSTAQYLVYKCHRGTLDNNTCWICEHTVLGYKIQRDSIIVSHAGHTTINHSLLQVVNIAITE